MAALRIAVSPALLANFLTMVLALPSAAQATFEAFTFAEVRVACVGAHRVTDVQPSTASALTVEGGTPSDPTTCSASSPIFGKSMGAVAFGSASIVKGHLEARGFALGFAEDPSIRGGGFVEGVGFASIQDVVTVSGPFSGQMIARVGLEVQGELEGFAAVGSTVRSSSLQGFDCRGTWLTSCVTLIPPGTFDFDVILNIAFSAADPSFDLLASIFAAGTNDGLAEALGSAQLFIELPPGFTFTSESGLLLTQLQVPPDPPGGQVPEPPLVLLLASAGGMAWLVRRRRLCCVRAL